MLYRRTISYGTEVRYEGLAVLDVELGELGGIEPFSKSGVFRHVAREEVRQDINEGISA